MTISELQDDLMEELRALFSGFLTKSPQIGDDSKAILSKLNIFGQTLPIGEEEPYPYILVRIDSGAMKGDSANLVKVRLFIGTFDDSINANGHKDVINIIQKIYERFAKNPVLASKYAMKNDSENPFAWVLQEKDSYPYYFGTVEFTWETMAIRKESQYT